MPAPIEIPQTVMPPLRSVEPIANTGPPAVSVTEINDPTAVGEAIEVIKQDAVQLNSRRLRARRIVLRLKSSVLLFQSTNLSVRTRTKLQDGLVAFVAFGPRSAGTINGLPIGPDRVLASPSGVEVEFVVDADYDSVSFILEFDGLELELRRRHRADFRVPDCVELLQPSPGDARALYDLGRRLVDVASRQGEVFERSQARAAAQAEVFESLLATLGSTNHVYPALHERTQLAHSRIIQLVENHVMVHAGDHLHVADLCEAADISERTLQYAFKELMGMSPVAYLTRLRLHQVRKSLRKATHASTTVTKEALRWGFWHFGDFSRAYKDCFGELPSDTLRRDGDAG